MAIAPSWVADKDEREPKKPPIGVRATPTIQTSVVAYQMIKVKIRTKSNSEQHEGFEIIKRGNIITNKACNFPFILITRQTNKVDE